MALSVKRVQALKRVRRYGDGSGLVLKVKANGSKSWQFRYMRNGRERYMGLGSTDLVSLAEARELALAARKQLLAGIDPQEARKEASARVTAETAARITFAEAAQQYFNQSEQKWKNAKHRAQFLSTLKQYAFPVLGAMPVDTIVTAAVLRCLDPIWHANSETASRVRQQIEKVLAWSIVRGFRAAPNPAQWTNHLKEALPARSQIAKVEHHPALAYAELPAFMAALHEREGFAARGLEFLILTAARTGEVIGARWSEIDFENKLWTVPEGRIKASREHRVPLSAPALALLTALPRESDFVSPGLLKGTALSNMAMATLLKAHGLRSDNGPWDAVVFSRLGRRWIGRVIELCIWQCDNKLAATDKLKARNSRMH